jgi:ADP-dependent NAD(P)H-hydrate dehydratase / NAD(P)H-hydrate epimerase
MAGRLAVVGGNLHGFASVAQSYQLAGSLGAGYVRAVVPDALKRTIPATILDIAYAASTPSGGFAHDDTTLQAAVAWADVSLLVGDSGRSSETAVAFEQLLRSGGRLVFTRDAADLVRNASMDVVTRPDTGLVLSFAQLQKLLQAVYYPRMLSFSMQLLNLVETLHKFTITYPCWIATYHQDQIVIAHEGQVVTMPFSQPMMIWRGDVATRMACYWLWNLGKPLEAAATSLCASEK